MAVKTQMVTFASNGGESQGFLAYTDDNKKHPGIVIIQEWWGLNENIKNISQKLAGEGFITLAPDLYHGKATKEPDEAQKLMMNLNREQALEDLQGAISFLKTNENVDPGKVGVTGFCMGGTLAFAIAGRSSDVGAVVPFYGVHFEPEDVQKYNLKVPVMAIYGEKDPGSPPAKVEKMKQALAKESSRNQVIVYPGAQHAFMNDTTPQVYNSNAANDAWRHMVEFMKGNLVPVSVA